MSIFEWFFESSNPEPVGKIAVNPPDDDDEGKRPKKWLLYLTVLGGLLLTSIGLFWVFYDVSYAIRNQIIEKLCYFVGYLVVSHYIKSMPDSTNLRWFGGVIANPFRISDDFNLLLLIIHVIILPGKLITYSLMMSWAIIKHFFRRLIKN